MAAVSGLPSGVSGCAKVSPRVGPVNVTSYSTSPAYRGERGADTMLLLLSLPVLLLRCTGEVDDTSLAFSSALPSVRPVPELKTFGFIPSEDLSLSNMLMVVRVHVRDVLLIEAYKNWTRKSSFKVWGTEEPLFLKMLQNSVISMC